LGYIQIFTFAIVKSLLIPDLSLTDKVSTDYRLV